MLEFCLLMLPGMVDSEFSESARVAASASIMTCARPVAHVINPDQSSAMGLVATSDGKSADRWLNRWHKATRELPTRTRSEQDEFRHRNQIDFNEHTLAAAEQLVGPVQIPQLKRTFEWRVAEDGLDEVCLEATPRDELERLFYGSLRVSLDVNRATVRKIVVIGRNQNQRTIWQLDETGTEETIELVRSVDDVPPSPNTMVRTADVRTERR